MNLRFDLFYVSAQITATITPCGQVQCHTVTSVAMFVVEARTKCFEFLSAFLTHLFFLAVAWKCLNDSGMLPGTSSTFSLCWINRVVYSGIGIWLTLLWGAAFALIVVCCTGVNAK